MLNRLKQIALGTLFGTLIAGQAIGQTATLLPNARQQFFTAGGIPAAGGTVDFYIPNTTTRNTTWLSSTESVGNQNTNPVLLDSGGMATIYGDGSYRQVVKDSDGNTIWDAVTASTGTGSGGGSTVLVGDGLAVGTILQIANTTITANYLYTAGQAVSRTTYAALSLAVTFNTTILCQAGIATITVTTDISDKTPIGAPIEAACFAPGTIVNSKSSGILTMNNNATTTLSVAAQIFPWGNGDGSTTFNVPDYRGRTLVGRDNMNSSVASRLTSTYYGSIPDAINAVGGSQFVTLTLGMLPAGITSANTGAIGLTVCSTAGCGVGIPFTSSPGNISTTGGGSAGTVVPDTTSTWGSITGSFNGTIPIGNAAVMSNNTGGTNTPTVQPSVTSDYIIKALPDTNISVATISQLQPGIPNELAGTNGSGIWGNITVPTGLSVSGSALNFNIPALTNQASPSANNDYLILYNAACSCTEKVSVGVLSSVGVSGVSSLGGLTGAITVSTPIVASGSSISLATNGITNALAAQATAFTYKCNPTASLANVQDCAASTVNTFTANHTIATTDCGNTVQMGTGSTTQKTVTLPTVFASSGKCPITLLNGNAYSAGNSRGMILSGFPANQFYILFPGASLHLIISNGAWVVDVPAPRWAQAGVQLYAVNGGSDTSNDCLSAATGCSSISHVVNAVLYPQIDNINSAPIVYLSGTFSECDTFAGQLVGVNVGFIEGLTLGSTVWNTNGACAALLVADNAEWETSNITYESTTANGSGVYVHQTGVVDLLAGTYFGSFSGTGSAVGSDHGGFINFDQSGGAVNIGPGNVGTFLAIGSGTQMIGSFTATGQASTTIGTWMTINGAGAMADYSGIAIGGTFVSIGTSTCRGPSAFTLGTSMPGGAPTATLGCQSM